MTNRATNPQALRDFLPPTAAPMPANANMGMVSHRAGNSRGCARAPVVTGPKVLMVTVEVTGTPLTGRLVIPDGYENEHTGGMVTSGVMVAQDRVTPRWEIRGCCIR